MNEQQQKQREYIAQIAATAQPNPGTSITGTILVGIDLILNQMEAHKPQEPTKLYVDRMAQDVVDFHVKFGINYDGICRMMPEELDKFRMGRKREELTEYREAKTREEKLDALVDLIYICLGDVHLHGVTPAQFAEAWRRVHAANMSKARATTDNPGKYGSPDDIIKPAGWVAPDLTDLVSLPPNA